MSDDSPGDVLCQAAQFWASTIRFPDWNGRPNATVLSYGIRPLAAYQ